MNFDVQPHLWATLRRQNAVLQILISARTAHSERPSKAPQAVRRVATFERDRIAVSSGLMPTIDSAQVGLDFDAGLMKRNDHA